MRLLDLVAQSSPPHPELAPRWPLPAPYHFADTLRWCPLRLVLTDELVRCATTLAYAEGDRLSGCLDLVRVPAERLWVEWPETARREALARVPELELAGTTGAKRGGALIQTDAKGRAGTLRTFWCTQEETACTAAVITEFDLDRPIRQSNNIEAVFEGATAGLALPREPALDDLLSHLRLRFDPAWRQYYRAGRLTALEKAAVLRTAVESTAFDTPMLLALFLIMAAKDGAQRRVVDLNRLNQARRRSGKVPLLEHIEVSGPLHAQYVYEQPADHAVTRRGPRLHHVRGHLARRGSKIFWRSPHLRGSARQGIVRSRTVELSFGAERTARGTS